MEVSLKFLRTYTENFSLFNRASTAIPSLIISSIIVNFNFNKDKIIFNRNCRNSKIMKYEISTDCTADSALNFCRWVNLMILRLISGGKHLFASEANNIFSIFQRIIVKIFYFGRSRGRRSFPTKSRLKIRLCSQGSNEPKNVFWHFS